MDQITRLADQPYVLLTTRRRDGSTVGTPVWIARHQDRLVVWTPAGSGKVRRIRTDDRVTLAPSTFNGTPTGDPVPGRARIVAADRTVRRAMAAKYGPRFRRFAILLGLLQALRPDRIIRDSRLRRAAGGPVAITITLDRQIWWRDGQRDDERHDKCPGPKLTGRRDDDHRLAAG